MRKDICFVDRGAIFRSPIAATLANQQFRRYHLDNQFIATARRTQGFAQDDPEMASYWNITYYPDQYNVIRPWLDAHAFDFTKYIAAGFSGEYEMKLVDMIIAFDKRTIDSLRTISRDCDDKIHYFSEICAEASIDVIDPQFIEKSEGIMQVLTQIEQVLVTNFPTFLNFIDP